MSDAKPHQQLWVIVAPDGAYWLVHAEDENDAWILAFDWPSEKEIADAKAKGWYAAPATVKWEKPAPALTEAGEARIREREIPNG